MRFLKEEEIESMTKLNRKSWKVRSLRYAELVPSYFFTIDPKSRVFKNDLKEWIKASIPKDGDNIFKGKINKKGKDENDWLTKELEDWKKGRDDFLESIHAFEELGDI